MPSIDRLRGKALPKFLGSDAAEHMPSVVWRALVPGSESARRTARANFLAMKGQDDRAAEQLAQIIATEPDCGGAVRSLGFLVGHRSLTNMSQIWSALRRQWEETSPAGDYEVFRFYLLGLEFLWKLEPERAEREVRNVYMPFFAAHERQGKSRDTPVFYWHVPKTGGTSVSGRLSKEWYKSGMAYLPTYAAGQTLSWLARNQDGLFPYLSSAHMSARALGLEGGGGYREFVVTRDPVDRALSAWRHYRQNPMQRLWILQQHGDAWDFFPICSVKDWCQRAPFTVTNAVSHTFQTPERLSAVETRVPLEALDQQAADILSGFGIDAGEQTIRTSKNSTKKSIRPDRDDLPLLESTCAPDTSFLKTVDN